MFGYGRMKDGQSGDMVVTSFAPQTFTSKIGKRELLIALAVTLIVALGLTIGVGLLAARTRSSGDVCVTPECAEVAGYISSNLNASVDPCQDFYQYACGGWMAKNPPPPNRVRIYVKQLLRDANQKRMETLLMSSINNKLDSSYERKLKSFYQTCLRDYNRASNASQHLLELLSSKIKGWYVLKPTAMGSWDFGSVFPTIWGDVTNVFVYAMAQPTIRRPTDVTLTIRKAAGKYVRTIQRPDVQRAYRDYVKSTGQLLLKDAGIKAGDADANKRLDEFVDDVISLEVNLSKIINKKSTKLDRTRKLKVGDLRNLTTLPLADLLTSYYKDAGVTDDREVEMRSSYVYCTEVNALLRQFGEKQKRILNNYLTWRYLDSHASRLSPRYSLIQNTFRRKAYGDRGRYYSSIKDSCVSYVRWRMGDALSAEFAKYFYKPKRQEKVDKIYQQVRATAAAKVDEWVWMDEPTKKVSRQKLNTVTETLGYPDYLANSKHIDDLYKQADVKLDFSFYKNIMNTNILRKNHANIWLQGKVKDHWRARTLSSFSIYVGSWNEVQLAAGYLQFPFYWLNIPDFYNFASIGVTMAYNILQAVDDRGNTYFANGSYTDQTWWTPATQTNYNKARQCFVNYLDQQVIGPFNLPDISPQNTTFKVSGDAVATFIMRRVGAIRLAYKAWKAWSQKLGKRPIPAGLQWSQDQMFFVTAAQKMCRTTKPSYAYRSAKLYKGRTSNLVNQAMAQIEELRSAFQCPAKSTLNPDTKCRVF